MHFRKSQKFTFIIRLWPSFAACFSHWFACIKKTQSFIAFVASTTDIFVQFDFWVWIFLPTFFHSFHCVVQMIAFSVIAVNDQQHHCHHRQLGLMVNTNRRSRFAHNLRTHCQKCCNNITKEIMGSLKKNRNKILNKTGNRKEYTILASRFKSENSYQANRRWPQ